MTSHSKKNFKKLTKKMTLYTTNEFISNDSSFEKNIKEVSPQK